MRRVIIAVGLLIIAGAMAGCKDRSAKPPAGPVSSSARTAVGREYVEWAGKMENAVMSMDGFGADALVDYDSMLDKAGSGISVSAAMRTSFGAEVKRGSLGQGLVAQRRDHATYRFLRAFSQDGRVHAVFRLLLKGGGMNYHDWTVARNGRGNLVAVDVFIAATGEYFSQTLHRMMAMAVAAADPSLISRLTGTDRALVDHGKDLSEMADDVQSGRFKEVRDLYNRLPESLQKEKVCFIYRIVAAGKLDKDYPGEYEKSIKDFEKEFKDDPSVVLLGVDGAFLAKDWTKCYRLIDKLADWTGGDAYLEGLRGTIMILEGKPGAAEAAEKAARGAIATEDRLLGPHLLLVKSLALQEKYGPAVEELKVYERMAGSEVAAATFKEMKGLEDSAEYKAYRSGATSSGADAVR